MTEAVGQGDHVNGTWLITGLRGNGKTLMAVGMMDRLIKSGRPVFASNFEELTLPGVQFLEDPKQWQDLPAGSVLFVDEAQRFWRSRRHGDPGPEVYAMETQRHDGVSMVLLTQQPTYIDKHVRGLVDIHRHLIRRAGLPVSQVYEWERCKEEPENPAVVELADKWLYTHEKEYFGTYKSAEVHTVKRRIPRKVKMIAVGAVAVIAMMWWAVQSISPDVEPAGQQSVEAVASAEGAATARPVEARSAMSLLEAMQPRIPGAPWSAPIYDEVNQVQAAPKVACMIGSVCRCLTTQGTQYHVDQVQCRAIVKNGGILNPYLVELEVSDAGEVKPLASDVVGPERVPEIPVGVTAADLAKAATGLLE